MLKTQKPLDSSIQKSPSITRSIKKPSPASEIARFHEMNKNDEIFLDSNPSQKPNIKNTSTPNRVLDEKTLTPLIEKSNVKNPTKPALQFKTSKDFTAPPKSIDYKKPIPAVLRNPNLHIILPKNTPPQPSTRFTRKSFRTNIPSNRSKKINTQRKLDSLTRKVRSETKGNQKNSSNFTKTNYNTIRESAGKSPNLKTLKDFANSTFKHTQIKTQNSDKTYNKQKKISGYRFSTDVGTLAASVLNTRDNKLDALLDKMDELTNEKINSTKGSFNINDYEKKDSINTIRSARKMITDFKKNLKSKEYFEKHQKSHLHTFQKVKDRIVGNLESVHFGDCTLSSSGSYEDTMKNTNALNLISIRPEIKSTLDKLNTNLKSNIKNNINKSADLSKTKVGDQVIVNGIEKKGYIRYIGNVVGKEGEWAGVELEGAFGKNNGSVGGIKYFECLDNMGIFVRLNKISKKNLEDSTTEETVNTEKELDKISGQKKTNIKVDENITNEKQSQTNLDSVIPQKNITTEVLINTNYFNDVMVTPKKHYTFTECINSVTNNKKLKSQSIQRVYDLEKKIKRVSISSVKGKYRSGPIPPIVLRSKSISDYKTFMDYYSENKNLDIFEFDESCMNKHESVLINKRKDTKKESQMSPAITTLNNDYLNMFSDGSDTNTLVNTVLEKQDLKKSINDLKEKNNTLTKQLETICNYVDKLELIGNKLLEDISLLCIENEQLRAEGACSVDRNSSSEQKKLTRFTKLDTVDNQSVEKLLEKISILENKFSNYEKEKSSQIDSLNNTISELESMLENKIMNSLNS
ncbi:hypothetical protein BB559_000397 [Furculomyces boomerangus]|uniref:CAP-Gly domain-containing protein n=1 Tax=Furculomyces boomerangus TaxID=61424 RepID=A0A2T9Z5E2_9FUNG|nr:hypothetical protein BB559_000397 [Furculomyces boomerangus]